MVATSEIIVESAERALLEIDNNLLQEGFNTNAMISVYDSNNNKFSEDQFKNMNLVLT